MKTVFGYYKIYIPFMFIVLFALFGQVWCELSLPRYMSDIIDNGIVAGDMEHIKSVGTIMILVAALAGMNVTSVLLIGIGITMDGVVRRRTFRGRQIH